MFLKGCIFDLLFFKWKLSLLYIKNTNKFVLFVSLFIPFSIFLDSLNYVTAMSLAQFAIESLLTFGVSRFQRNDRRHVIWRGDRYLYAAPTCIVWKAWSFTGLASRPTGCCRLQCNRLSSSPSTFPSSAHRDYILSSALQDEWTIFEEACNAFDNALWNEMKSRAVLSSEKFESDSRRVK